MVIFYSLEKENKTSYKISVIAYSGPEEENPTGLAIHGYRFYSHENITKT